MIHMLEPDTVIAALDPVIAPREAKARWVPGDACVYRVRMAPDHDDDNASRWSGVMRQDGGM